MNVVLQVFVLESALYFKDVRCYLELLLASRSRILTVSRGPVYKNRTFICGELLDPGYRESLQLVKCFLNGPDYKLLQLASLAPALVS